MKIGYLLICSLTAAMGAEVQQTNAPKPASLPDKPPSSQQHWAYQQVKRPDVPAVQQKAWVKTPIDAFILAALEAKGVKPSADADRATFIRRATLDAWGVIPTPDAVQAFVNDK